MRRLTLTLPLLLLLGACGGAARQENVSSNSATTTTTTNRASETPRAETPTPQPTATATTTSGPSPVEFTYLGVAPDKEHIRYRIKVNSDKPVSQVDLGIKYTDDGGKVVDDTTYAWQNIVKSTRQPIEKGKTYDIEDEMPVGATRADVTLKRVIFADGSRWEAQ